METRACPYYLAREDQDEAEITVLPYNYLFDTTMRRAQKIDVSNAIVIVDEAHNLEKHAEETASFDLTPIVLANCIDDVGLIPAIQFPQTSTSQVMPTIYLKLAQTGG